MHKCLLFNLIFFFSCNFQTNLFDKLNNFYHQGHFYKIIEFIQKEEIKNDSFKNNLELYLWKARIYSLNIETYGIARSYYELYIQKKALPEIYLEYALFLMDIKDFPRIKKLISGENIPPDIIFHPHIADIRNFLECYNKIGNQYFINVIKKTDFIKHPFFYNYCLILNLDFLKNSLSKLLPNYSKFFYEMNFASLEEVKKTLLEIDSILKLLKIHEKNKIESLISFKELLEAFVRKNEREYLNKNYYFLCSLQKHFINITLIPIDITTCQNLYPNNPTLHRELINSEIPEVIIDPHFHNELYIP